MTYPPPQPGPQDPGPSQPEQPGEYGQPGQFNQPAQPGQQGPPNGGQVPPPHQANQPYGAQPPPLDQYGQPYGVPGAYGTPYGQVGPTQRPVTVTIGAILTWIGSAMMVVLGLILAIAGGSIGLSDMMPDMAGLATGVMVGAGVFVMVLGLIPLLLGVFAFRGSKGALIGLTVIGGLWVLLMLVSMFSSDSPLGSIISILWIAGATVLFWVGRDWYDARRRNVTTGH